MCKHSFHSPSLLVGWVHNPSICLLVFFVCPLVHDDDNDDKKEEDKNDKDEDHNNNKDNKDYNNN